MHGVERGCVRQRRRWARARAAGAKGLYGVAYRTSSMADSKESNIYEQNRIAAAIKRSGFEEQLFYLIKNNHVQGIEHLFHKWQKQQQKTPMYKLKSMIMCCGLCRTSPSPVNLKIFHSQDFFKYDSNMQKFYDVHEYISKSKKKARCKPTAPSLGCFISLCCLGS